VRLVLIDGTAVLYRAFFAIRGLSTRAGRPTNAVFGFIRMLTQMRHQWSPTHWLVVFDGGLPAERLALLETYKAQRAPMPDALREQKQTVEDYLDRASVPWIRQDGQEADDVMASMAEWAGDAGEVLIATTDKDMFQLVDERVCIVSMSGKATRLDAEGVRAKTGVAPDKIVEWLALVGDTSDNIPGVPGVGPKTAARLLDGYGSLADLWEGLQSVKSDRLREALSSNRDAVERNLEMVRLRKDLECGLSWDDLAVRDPDPARLLPLLRELEFHGMARDLAEPTLFGDMEGE